MLDWNTRKVNDIPTNPIDCHWAIGFVGAYPRLYTIVEQYPTDTGGFVTGVKPELYVLFENIDGHAASEGESEEWKNSTKWGDFLFRGHGRFVHAYRTFDEAKARAETQIGRIQEIINAYFPK